MRLRFGTTSALVVAVLFFLIPGIVFAGTIDTSYKYGWGENFGWINFAPTDSGNTYHGLTVTDSLVTGYAWSKTYGWINFSPTNGGVTNTCSGVLGGHAWSTELGWIPLTGVTINSSGEFTGTGGSASSAAGRITFDCDHCDVRTDWRHCSAASCGNGVVEGSEACDSGGSNGSCPSTCSSSCTVNTCDSAPAPTCANGASDYPTCTPPPTPTCANGASDYPTCTPPPEPTCANGASDYPTCTPPPTPTCANGASDYPTCTPPPEPTCANGASNYPTCTLPGEPPVDVPPDLPPTDQPPQDTGTGGGSGTDTGGSVGGTVQQIANQIGNQIGSTISETATVVTDFVAETFESIAEIPAVAATTKAVGAAVAKTKEVFDNPVVEKTNETIAAPVIATVAVANVVAGGFQFSQLLLYLRLVFSQPFLLYKRRKQKQWGVVYNSFTKQPLDLAAVRLINAETGNISQTQVTDGQGRYFISGDPGVYRIEVQKSGFTSTSEYLKNFSEDHAFANLYHGEKFKVEEDKKELNYSIPLDPELEKKTTTKLIAEYTRIGLQNSISLIGIIATIISLIISPKSFIVGLLVFHLLVYLLIRRLTLKKRKAAVGVISSSNTHKGVGKAVVRVFDSNYHKLVAMAVTDRKGRYAILVGPSTYYITVEKKGYRLYESGVLDFSSEKTAGMGGLLTENAVLEPMSNSSDTGTTSSEDQFFEKMNKE